MTHMFHVASTVDCVFFGELSDPKCILVVVKHDCAMHVYICRMNEFDILYRIMWRQCVDIVQRLCEEEKK